MVTGREEDRLLGSGGISNEPATRQRIALGYDPIEISPSEPVVRSRPTRAWIVEVESGKAEPVNVGRLHVMAVQWSPAEDQLLLTVANNTTPDEQQLRPRLVTVGADGGTPALYCPTRGKLLRAAWSPDGKAIAFLGSLENGSDFYPGGLFVCRGPGTSPRDLAAGSDFAVESFCWSADGKALLATIMQGTRRALATINCADGKVVHRTAAPWEVAFRSDFSVSPASGRIACVLSQSDRPPDVWVIARDGRQKQLTHLNPGLEQRSFGKGEAIRWTAEDGWQISGILIKPVGYRPGRRYPLVVYLHGSNVGDANDFHASPSHWGQLLATRGYAVLLPNYRGSLTDSSKFRRGARGDFGEKDLRDVLAGVEHLVRQGIADPERLGIGGISYGGYLTARAVTQTTRFKAAIMASGISNWFSLHTGQTAAPESAVRLEWDRSPFDAATLLWDRSPVAHVRDVKTPTLIFWGEHDPAIPVSQAVEFYRGLRHYRVPSQLVIYPREGHVIRETNHLKHYYQRILDWFGNWVTAGPEEKK